MNLGIHIAEVPPTAGRRRASLAIRLSFGEPAVPGPVTISGEITCLPKVGSGVQTLECAIGLLSDDGRYYGLRRDDPDHQLSQGGLRVEVSGNLVAEDMTGPDGNRYDTAGIIDVTSFNNVVRLD